MTELDHVFSARPMTPDDYGFLVDSFKKSHAKAHRVRSRREFQAYWRPLFDRVLALEETHVRILCRTTAPEHIAGWIAWSRPVKTSILHYLYVKLNYRPLRLSEKLLQVAGMIGRPVVYTFGSPRAQRIAARFEARGLITGADHYPAEEFLAAMETDAAPERTDQTPQGRAQGRADQEPAAG